LPEYFPASRLEASGEKREWPGAKTARVQDHLLRKRHSSKLQTFKLRNKQRK
jgi:hypothetical protein